MPCLPSPYPRQILLHYLLQSSGLAERITVSLSGTEEATEGRIVSNGEKGKEQQQGRGTLKRN